MATSGTIGSTIFETQKVIDHAFRRCKLVPQEIAGEHLETALETLWLWTRTLSSRGIKLWNIDRFILPMYNNMQTVPAPLGTIDILDINLRTQNRITGTASATEGVADNAFDGNLTTACTQVAADGSITMELTTGGVEVFTFGVLPNVTATWSYVIEASTDGITYAPLITNTNLSVEAGIWIWADIEGAADFTFYRLRGTGGTVLDVIELVYQNRPQEIPLYQLNRTDYSNLPDKTRAGRPTQYWYDRQRTRPLITLWQPPELQFTFAQLTGYLQREIQDIGTMVQEIEVPDRWYMATVCNLAQEMAREIKEVDAALIPIIDADAKKYLDQAWDGETDSSDIFWRANTSPYTR